MKPNIQKIINELIEIDASFQSKKKELEKMISEIIKSKPNFEINPTFVSELKEELYNQAESENQSLFSKIFTMQNFQPFGVGAVLTALILTPLFYSMWGTKHHNVPLEGSTYSEKRANTEKEAGFFADDSIEPDGLGGLMQNSITVNSLGNNAFGKIAPQSSEKTMTSFRGGEIENESMMDSESMASSKMIMPYNPVRHKYVYDGQIDISNDDLKVLRLQKQASKVDAKNLLSVLNLELLDSNVFKNLMTENVSIKENREFGYIINILNDNAGNSLSIYKNWEKWPNPNDNCKDEACYAKHRLKPSDIPSDEKLIAIANEFTKKLKIDMTPYGQPSINKNHELYAQENTSELYVPNEITITYPIKIEEQEVINQQGNPEGLNVNIDIRHKKASGLHGLRVQQYESANYKPVSLEKIESAIEKGGHHYYEHYQDDVKIVEVKLGEPKEVLSKFHQWNGERGKNSELFVPSLYFPVLEKPKEEEYFNKNAIVIPLADDLYDEELYPFPKLTQPSKAKE